jgi:hypothetical protein
MLSRARRRPFVTVGLALALAGGIFALLARRPHMYDAEVALLITEGAFAPDGRPRPRGELRGFINHAIFTTSRMDALVSKHDLVTKLRAASREEAREELRRLVVVRTWHDYFQGYRQRQDPPRTARVTIAFSAPEPELALAVARDLGETVAETQGGRAAEVANARVEAMRAVAANAAGRAVRLEAQLDRAVENARTRPSASSQGLTEQLSRIVRTAQHAAKLAAADLVDAQLRAHAVRRLGGLVQVVDPGLPYWRVMPRNRRLTRYAILSLLVATLGAVILVGAFDPTVLLESDIQRAGIRPVGSVPVRRGQSSPTEV